MDRPTLEPPIGARIRLIDGELGTIVRHLPEQENLSAEVEQDSGTLVRVKVRPLPVYVDPSRCSEPGCEKWAAVEATKTAWASDYPRRAARRLELGHTPFCVDHVPRDGNTWWAAVRPIGADLPLPGAPE